MATANPIEDLLSTDIDESAVSALVGSLESRLASPTHKELSHQITASSVNSNHVDNHPNVTAITTSPFTVSQTMASIQGQKGSQSQNNPAINNLFSANAKSSDSQILGINSILHSSNASPTPGGVSVLNVNTLNSTSTNPRTVNNTSNIMLLPSSHTPPHPAASHTPPHVTVGPNGNLTYSVARTTQIGSAVTAHNNTNTGVRTVASSATAMYSLASIAAEQKPLDVPTAVMMEMKMGHNSVMTVREQLDKHQANSPGSTQFIVKQEARHIKQEPHAVHRMHGSPDLKTIHVTSHPGTPPSNVHVVNASKGMQVMGNTPGSPSVITVTRQTPGQGVGVVRPQVITTQASHANGGPQMTVVNVHTVAGGVQRPTNAPQKTVKTTRINAPIQIAPQQINIAPRPGTNTITLPPGLQLPQGTFMVKNDQGQFVFMSTGQHGGLQHHQTANPVQGKLNIQTVKPQPRHSSPQIVTIQPPGGQSTTGSTVIHSNPSTIHSGTPPHHIAGGGPSRLPTQVVNMSGPPLGQPNPGVPGVPISHSAVTTAQQQAMEHVKKCKNFLSTLIKLASSQPEQTIRNVRELIQQLIDGKVEPEFFTQKLQHELNSSPQPNLVPFLKKSLPLLRQSLIQNKMTIEGVKAPPTEVLQGPPPPHLAGAVPFNTRPQPPRPPHNIPHPQGQHIVRQITPQQLAKMQGKVIAMSSPGPSGGGHKGGAGFHSKAGLSGAMPSTVHALQARVGGKHQDMGGGPGSQHKEKRKYESLKDADDDINDVATMGGVNLSEESKNILATNADFIGTHIRSCKDELFLHQGPLLNRISSIAKKFGVTDISSEVVSLVSHATQERLRNISERLSTIAEHRSEIYKMDNRFEVTQDTRSQLKFLEELDKLEKKRHEEQEREILLRAAKVSLYCIDQLEQTALLAMELEKSRSKTEDPEQAKLKQKAKELQQAEADELRQAQANITALAAIGPRKKRKVETGESSSSSSLPNGVGTTTPTRPTVSNRPRIKRVNLKDLLFLMEQEKETCKSPTLYKAFLK